MPDWYPDLLDAVADKVKAGSRRAVSAVNRELVTTYWAIGRDILDRQSQEGWGSRVIDRLSTDLRERYPSVRGYSPRNLKYMRAFAAAWTYESIVQGGSAQLTWSHYVALTDKVYDSAARLWYAATAASEGWSLNILIHQIDTRLYERTGRAITNFPATLAAADSDLAQEFTRDPYVFDFVGTAASARERTVEQTLIEYVERFLLELGMGFAFVGRQVLLRIGNQEFYANLLFYHLALRRYVVVELKVGAFDPSYLGQLGMYMAAVDDLKRHPDDLPTIGLLLCKSKDNLVVEYALRAFGAPIGVAEWAETVSTSVPAEIAASLPSIEEIEAELVGFDDENG